MNIQIVRMRNVGVKARLIVVSVTRGPDGAIGIGLDAEDRVLEITNPNQPNLKVGDQIRRVHDVFLGDGNIVAAMKQVPKEVETFAVEVLRWPKEELPFWEITLDVEVVAHAAVSHGPQGPASAARVLAKKETAMKFSRRAVFNSSTIVTLNRRCTNKLNIKLVRDGAFGLRVEGEVALDLGKLGSLDRPWVRWVPMPARDPSSIVGEVLMRVTRCDWAHRTGTSPDTGRDTVPLSLPSMRSAKPPLQNPKALDRIEDLRLDEVIKAHLEEQNIRL